MLFAFGFNLNLLLWLQRPRIRSHHSCIHSPLSVSLPAAVKYSGPPTPRNSAWQRLLLHPLFQPALLPAPFKPLALRLSLQLSTLYGKLHVRKALLRYGAVYRLLLSWRYQATSSTLPAMTTYGARPPRQWPHSRPPRHRW